MAHNLLLQLENSVGLMKVVVCTGLKHPVVIHPIIHSEPLLTAQAFYYLEEMESVVHLRYTDNEDHISEEELEYLTDNYLFEYSKAHPESKMTSKVMQPKFLEFDPSDMYLMADAGHSTAAAFEPYSRASKNVEVALPLIIWLAVLCIEKDYALTCGA